jgi:hypothetical protein
VHRLEVAETIAEQLADHRSSRGAALRGDLVELA